MGLHDIFSVNTNAALNDYCIGDFRASNASCLLVLLIG